MGSRCAALCLVGVALGFARTAPAEDIGREPLAPLEPPTSPVPPAVAATGRISAAPDAAVDRRDVSKRRWYGWQTLLVDAIPVLGLTIVAAQRQSDDSDKFIVGFVATYFIGGPIVHLGHGQFGKAALSFGVRSAGPLMIAAGADLNDSRDNAGTAALVVLGALAIPAAIAIDAAAIAREDVPREQSASIVQRLGFAPWLDPKRRAAGLALDLSL